jgi:hypothetical protein
MLGPECNPFQNTRYSNLLNSCRNIERDEFIYRNYQSLPPSYNNRSVYMHIGLVSPETPLIAQCMGSAAQ